MNSRPEQGVTRRQFIARSGAGLGMAAWASMATFPSASPAAELASSQLNWIKDTEVRAGVEAAIRKNILPAAVETAYPGHFQISADGLAYGGDATWPGLDSWQMCGAYLALGRGQLVLDYFNFVSASRRKDGNVPFAIFPEMQPDGACLRGLKYPDDVFAYTPPEREGLPESSWKTRKWIGLFDHWQNIGTPLKALGPVCYVLTAGEIFDATKASDWLRAQLPAIDAAAKYVHGMTAENGLIDASGFYTEQPPRLKWDGVTQCYAVRAYHETSRLHAALGNHVEAEKWKNIANILAAKFIDGFWRDDHFGEYIHPEHGLVDAHGLSDVNWAAVAFQVATGEHLKILWPRLLGEKGFWPGDMPTLTVTKPTTYEPWELNPAPPCSVPPLNDVAAMGRAWYLESLACQQMKEYARLMESTRLVCRAAAKTDGFWRERYHPQPDDTATPAGAQKYCEYPAVLVRVVLGNRDVFA